MNKKRIICKYRKYSRGSIFADSPKKPGAKDGKIGLSKYDNITAFRNFTKIISKNYWDFEEKKSHALIGLDNLRCQNTHIVKSRIGSIFKK